MKILLWYWGRRGGGAQFTLGLARALLRRTDVTLRLSLSAQVELLPAFRALGSPLHLVPTYRDRASFLLSLPRLPALTREFLGAAEGSQVVVSAMSHLWTPMVAPALTRAGIPFVPVIHDAFPHPGDLSFGWNWRLGRELRSAQAAVMLSGAVAEAIRKRRPTLPQIRMPLPALLEGETAVPRMHPGKDEIRLLFFGRIRRYKGLDLLRDAFSAVRARHPGLQLRVVGEGNLPACAPGLNELPGVSVDTRWVPEGDIPALLAGSDAVILPYREASQSGVVPQALAMGIPILVTPVGGLVEQVKEGAGGIVAAAPTATAIAEAIERLMVPGSLAALREQALAASRRSTDWDSAADELMAKLSRMLS